jgi:hypothetical protein
MIQIGINIAVKGAGISGPPPAPVNSTPPVISGTTTLGSVLTTTDGTWTNSPISYTYQWKRGATNIGTNASTYTLVIADSTAAITCVVTATNASGSTPATSNTITAGNYAPVNTVAPVVTGTPAVGSVLTTTDGTWIGSHTFTYQWYTVSTALPIAGATSTTYTLQQTDADTEVYCEVTANNAAGTGTGNSNSFYIYDADYYVVYTTLSINVASYAQSQLQNRLMLDIKAAGAWAKLDTFFVFATDGDEYYAALDWKNPNQLASNIGCVFNINQGFVGDGSSAFFDTQFDPYNTGINYQQDNASRYFFPYAFVGAGPMDGLLGAENRMLLNNTIEQRINQDNSDLSGPFEYTNTVEPKSIHRTSVTNIRLYNGTVAENRTAFSAVPFSETQRILTSDSVYATHTVAAYAMGASMTAENTAFIAAWNTYITSI